QPERRVRLGDEVRERQRRYEQHRSAENRPISAAERRNRKRIRKPHERADESGQRDELKQLVRRVMKAGLRQLGCDDAPEQPDRKPEMLGKNRPDEITLSDRFARGFPERLILRIPIRNPGRIPLPHQYVPFWVAIAAVARAIPLRADGKTKKRRRPALESVFPGRRRCRLRLVPKLRRRQRWRRLASCFTSFVPTPKRS